MQRFTRTFEQRLRKKIIFLMVSILLLTMTIGYAIVLYFQYRSNQQSLKNQNDHLIQSFQQVEQALQDHPAPSSFQDSIALYQQFYTLRKQVKINSLQQFMYVDQTLQFTSNRHVDGMDESYIQLLKQRILKYEVAYLSYQKDQAYVLIGLMHQKMIIIYQMQMDDLLSALDIQNDPFVLVNQQQQVIIAGQSQFHLQQKASDRISQQYLFDQKPYYGIFQKLHGEYMMISYGNHRHPILWVEAFYVIGLVVLFMTVAIFIYSKTMADKTAHSLNLLMQGSQQIKSGNMQFRFALKTSDEFEDLAKEINEMLNQIQNLNENAIQLVNANKQSQIKQLTAQFHPHFLYNMLETIRYMIILDSQKASEMIVQLTKVLRYSIDDSSSLVTLKQDMEYLQTYLKLHQARFQKRLTYALNIDPACHHFLVPKLCIQPLIENSIVHNFKNVENLHIQIDIHQVGHELSMQIKDDGEGMDEQWLKYYQYWSPMEQATNHLGIENVLRRLYLTYFNRFFYHIESSHKGTIIELKIQMEDYVSSIDR